MKRRNFKAVVADNSGNTFIGERVTFAWNSAIKATEAIVREHARSQRVIYSGEKASVLMAPEKTYSRYWESPSGERVQALVWEVV